MELGEAPNTEQYFRNILRYKEVDAITIATPEESSRISWAGMKKALADAGAL